MGATDGQGVSDPVPLGPAIRVPFLPSAEPISPTVVYISFASPEAAHQVTSAMDETGLGGDLVRRAISLYQLVEERREAGQTLAFVREDGTVQEVALLW